MNLRRTKIVATIGPASESREVIDELLRLDVNVFRLNFSHGTQDEHRRRIRLIRRCCRAAGKEAAIMQDLCGPKIRVRSMEGGGAMLQSGSRVRIDTRPTVGNSRCFSTTYRRLPGDVRKGTVILLDDGRLELLVTSRSEHTVSCRVIRGGFLAGGKGMNLPGATISAPAVTPKDLRDLKLGIEENVDFVALSFVRRAEDVRRVRRLLDRQGSDAQIISKIEKPQAVGNIDALLDVSDGILVARGDLGVEMDLARVPVLQKDMVRRANEKDKYVIVATQMLDSMIRNPVPTRAEVSDVTNAILDGADALMLSGETAIGSYPAGAVRMLERIAVQAENYAAMNRPPWDWTRINPVHPVQDAVALAAFDLCRDLKAAAIAAYSATGGTALFLSRNRPSAPIVAFTSDRRALRRMHLFWGVMPVLDPSIRGKDGLIAGAKAWLSSAAPAKREQALVVVAGSHFGEVGSTNGVEVAVLP